MPQMSPMWWTTMMMMFLISFMLVMSILYFNCMNLMNKDIQIKSKKLNWKW
uniref:ATP synthase F0 subunit 8 n=1 Tax=Singapora shinshana TaxID=1539856 RepID=UPI0022388410|nr:ATP synthase F0 subunit 8 [Singapora shinshana]UYF20491.1 ATP synthase F0 subunit 8 [Singapora shinshana]